MRRALASVSFLLALAAPAASAPEAKGMWDGCGEGSWVHTKTTSKMVVPGVEIPPQVTETKQTLVKVTDDAWTVRTETKFGEEWTTAGEFPMPRKAMLGAVPETPKPEDLGTESVTVDGKAYSCKKTRIVLAGTTTTSWVSDEVGLLKSESTGPEGASSTIEVTSLSKKAKAGDQEVTCRETKTVSKAAGMESSIVALSSERVPGHVVRSEMRSVTGGTTSESTSEVVGFEIK